MRDAQRKLLLALVVAAVIAACTSGDDGGRPGTPRVDRSTTSAIDYSKRALRGVEGNTTTTILERGKTRLAGIVRGPRGAVVNATVRVERLVFDRIITRDITSTAGGHWELADVPGGRYRIRAFKAPNVAQLEPVVVFVNDGENRRIDVIVETQLGHVALGTVAPDPPVLGRALSVVVLLAYREVGGDGIVRATPVPGVEVELISSSGRWTLRSDPSRTTNSAGRASFEMTCELRGPPALLLRVPSLDLVLGIDAPACAVPSGGTTTTTSSSTSTTGVTIPTSSTTSTTTDTSTSTTTDPGQGGGNN